MNYNFSGDMQTPMRIEAQEIPQRDVFQNLCSIISKDGEIEKDVEHRIRDG